MTLNQWQERLYAHFRSLREVRKSNSIFALEHNLSEGEVAELGREIHSHIAQATPSDRHWFPWIVYSTELGYKYSGEEYWQTFSNNTPGWLEHEDRNFIRAAFTRFHREFQAASPTGRWAEAFRIICWPITHAILPQDLQQQLAEILYDIRDIYTLELLQSPVKLGEQIDAFSWRASSRFQKLADEHELVGQIAAALLHHGDGTDSNLILPSTLKRISRDLERERRAREWLTSAQTRAAKLRIRGLGRGFDDEEELDQPEHESEYRKTVVDLGIEPRLALFPRKSDSWEVRLDLPDLSRLLGRFPSFKAILANERCSIRGVKGPPLAKGALLYGRREVVLSCWTDSSEVLLKFENSIDELDYLLTTECLLRPGPRWLLKVLDDGTAIEIKTRIMRPGCRYVILTRTDRGVAHPGVHSSVANVDCEGITAVEVNVPDTLSEIYSDQLRELGFQTSGSLRVRPAGLPPANWDDEGYAEWLTSDSPLLAITADRQLNGMFLNLVGPSGGKIEIPDGQIISPVYVDLGPLEPGRYKLHVITQIESEKAARPAGILSITIRSPRVSQSPETPATPFRVIVSPATPSLEEFWAGDATVELVGPKGRRAAGKIEMFKDSNCQDLIIARELPAMNLPCTAGAWQERINSLQNDVKVQNACSEARLCRILIRCEELGDFTLNCEREFAPVRWILKHENNGYWLRLAQYERQAGLKTYQFSYEQPTRLALLTLGGDESFRVPDAGGLFVADANAYISSMLVPPQMSSFAELELRFSVPAPLGTEEEVAQFLKTLGAWTDARTPGDPISRMRKERIVTSLRDRLISHFCGADWTQIEHKLKDAPTYLWDLRRVISHKPHQSAVGTMLFDSQPQMQAWNRHDVCKFLAEFTEKQLDLPVFSKSGEKRINCHAWIVEFAFRLMSDPETVPSWVGSDFGDGLRYLRQNSILLRVARFVFLLRTAERMPKVRRPDKGVG